MEGAVALSLLFTLAEWLRTYSPQFTQFILATDSVVQENGESVISQHLHVCHER